MILNKNTLLEAAREARNQHIYETFTAQRFDEKESYDLFISHSFCDKDYVVGLNYLFKIAGYKVYIDWIGDRRLDRNYVTSETAEIIKKRIAVSTGSAYVSTSNSTSSKWCPWELGVSDGMHGKVCILPVMDSSFKGQEYLGLYPYLEYAATQGTRKMEFWVYDREDRKKHIILREWLKGRKPFIHN